MAVLGIDRLLADPARWLAGRARVALLTNQAALTSARVPTQDALHAALGERLVLLLSPEHGLSGFGEDAVAVPDSRDPYSGLPVASLYGPRRRPDPELLAGVDAVVVDLPDVGVRCYTYATSVALLLEAARGASAGAGFWGAGSARAASAGAPAQGATELPVIVCDRPSLLGPRVDGPALDPARRSFLGYLPVPYQHGLTLGELMRFHARRMNGAPLTVIAVEGWHRDAARPPSGFVPPSPGLPTPAAVALYPGLVALEGTGLSEGRGTPLPFQLVGGPEVDAHALAAAIAGEAGAAAGVWARPLEFRPEGGKLAGRLCRGVQLHVTDASALRPLALGVRLLQELRRQGQLEWRASADMPWAGAGGGARPAREAWLEPVDGLLVDALLGDASVREAVDGRRALADVEREWLAAHRAFSDAAEAALLYPGELRSAAEAAEPAEPADGAAVPSPARPLPARPLPVRPAPEPPAPARSPGAARGRGSAGRPAAAAPLGLGIDAGASSTRWRLQGPAGELAGGRLAPLAGHLYGEVGRASAGSLLDELAAAVWAAVRAAVRAAGPVTTGDGPGGAAGRLGAVVAGVTGLDPAGEEGGWLRRTLAVRLGLDATAVTLIDDIELAFLAVFPERDGVLVYAGTGAIAVCRAAGGGRLRAGGHGYLLDDDGGGFSIGRAALRAVLRAADEAGTPPDTPLARRLYAAAGGSDWDRLRAYVYGGGRAAVAALVPAVAAAAAEGDAESLAILGWAGEQLARLARVLLERRGELAPVSLAGGVGRLGGELEARFRRALPGGVSVRLVSEEPAAAAARTAFEAAAGAAAEGG